jgi:Zn finger protein HypA/HybF involved in hydrogenase expression
MDYVIKDLQAECRECGWKGTISQCIATPDGVVCPKCNSSDIDIEGNDEG